MPMAPAAPSSLGDLYSKCVQLVNENKISAKNAFDLPLIDNMEEIVDSFMGGSKRKKAEALENKGGKAPQARRQSAVQQEEEHRFHEASCTIEASARIYACRVDCVHTDTYRVLGGLSSADMGDEDEAPGEDGKGAAKKRRICGVNTLERNESNIIQLSIESDEQSDPMFRRMAAAFDAGGAKGLLLNHLPIAEDLSLVFNGDVPLKRASVKAEALFSGPPKQLRADAIGMGDPGVASGKIAESRLCPEVDKFRKQLWGDKSTGFTMAADWDALFVAPATNAPGRGSRPAAVPSGAAIPAPLMDAEPVAFDDVPQMDDIPEPMLPESDAFREVEVEVPLALADGDGPRVGAGKSSSSDDAIVFDELFEKFCGGGGSHQFAYFDECWSKMAKDKDGKGLGVLQDAQPEGAIVEEVKEKKEKKPLFDLAGLDKPLRPIEMEPVHKHQLSDKAAQWQLHKDVPPYMIDRITMPSWQTWAKCDFACLGLRPHLMLKLVRKAQPPGDGPHAFSELFSTVVVENPDAFPWLASEGRGERRDFGDDGRADRNHADDMAEDGDDFDGSGMPSHLDVDPQDLFLRPDDKVVPGCDGDVGEGDDDYAPEVDFDLVDQPNTVGNTEIGYSRNSKFVDVKLVKKHLWDCISEDISAAQSENQGKNRVVANQSFQDLVRRTVRRMPKGETENLSVAVCFICALHLCNEKNLELAPEPTRLGGDFAIVGPP